VEVDDREMEDESNEGPLTRKLKGKARINDITNSLPDPTSFNNIFLHAQSEQRLSSTSLQHSNSKDHCHQYTSPYFSLMVSLLNWLRTQISMPARKKWEWQKGAVNGRILH